jgi:multiple sugar transport system ATP-binding protein
VQQFGTPAEIYERPANVYVAGFIGSPTMNFMAARVEAGSNGASLLFDGCTVSVPIGSAGARAGAGGQATGALAGRSVIAGIRPEHFVPVAANAPGALPITVELLEPTGADTYAVARIGSKAVTLRFAPKQAPRVGETAWIGIDPAAVNLFDPTSEQRIAG